MARYSRHSLLFTFYTSLEGITKKLVSYSPNVSTNTTVVFFSGNNTTIVYWTDTQRHMNDQSEKGSHV